MLSNFIGYKKSLHLVAVILQGDEKRNSSDLLGEIKFIAMYENLEILFVPVMGLLQWIWYLCELVKYFQNFNRLGGPAVEIMNGRSFYSAAIRNAGSQNNSLHFHGRYLFNVRNHGVSFLALHHKNLQNTLCPNCRNSRFWQSRVHIAQDKASTHCWNRMNDYSINVASLALITCFAILEKKIVAALGICTDADHSCRHTRGPYRAEQLHE